MGGNPERKHPNNKNFAIFAVMNTHVDTRSHKPKFAPPLSLRHRLGFLCSQSLNVGSASRVTPGLWPWTSMCACMSTLVACQAWRHCRKEIRHFALCSPEQAFGDSSSGDGSKPEEMNESPVRSILPAMALDASTIASEIDRTATWTPAPLPARSSALRFSSFFMVRG